MTGKAMTKPPRTAENRKRFFQTVGKTENVLRFRIGSMVNREREKCFTSHAVTRRRRKVSVAYAVTRARNTASQLELNSRLHPSLGEDSPDPAAYITQTNDTRQSVPIKVPSIILSTMSSRVKTPKRRSCGDLYMISGWASSSPRPTADLCTI